jgi:hypothetical protein
MVQRSKGPARPKCAPAEPLNLFDRLRPLSLPSRTERPLGVNPPAAPLNHCKVFWGDNLPDLANGRQRCGALKFSSARQKKRGGMHGAKNEDPALARNARDNGGSLKEQNTMQLSRTQLMCSFRGRMRLAAEAAEAAAKEAENRSPLLNDPRLTPVSQLRGHVDHDGIERITTQECLDVLAVPLHARNHAVFFRLNQLMQAYGWQPCRISGVSSSTDTRVRGYQRKTDKPSYPHDAPVRPRTGIAHTTAAVTT